MPPAAALAGPAAATPAAAAAPRAPARAAAAGIPPAARRPGARAGAGAAPAVPRRPAAAGAAAQACWRRAAVVAWDALQLGLGIARRLAAVELLQGWAGPWRRGWRRRHGSGPGSGNAKRPGSHSGCADRPYEERAWEQRPCQRENHALHEVRPRGCRQHGGWCHAAKLAACKELHRLHLHRLHLQLGLCQRQRLRGRRSCRSWRLWWRLLNVWLATVLALLSGLPGASCCSFVAARRGASPLAS